jgi:hypothetical protein
MRDSILFKCDCHYRASIVDLTDANAQDPNTFVEENQCSICLDSFPNHEHFNVDKDRNDKTVLCTCPSQESPRAHVFHRACLTEHVVF